MGRRKKHIERLRQKNTKPGVNARAEKNATAYAHYLRKRKSLADQKVESDRQFLQTGGSEDIAEESTNRSTGITLVSPLELHEGKSSESPINIDSEDDVAEGSVEPPSQKRIAKHLTANEQRIENPDLVDGEDLDPERCKDRDMRQIKRKVYTEKAIEEFMDDFDPERSGREMRKIRRKVYTESKRHKVRHVKYNGKGLLADSRLDLCDCCDRHCPGCHLPCPRCKSCKCGLDCRNNRRYVYKEVEVEGTSELYCFRG